MQTAEIHNADLWITTFKQTYSEKGLAQSKIWDPGTICITNAGENTGDCAILGIRACFPDSIIAVIADESKSDTVFLKYAIDQLKPRLRRITRGATQDNLSVAKLTAFKFPAPPLEEQQRIGAVLRVYGDLIENNRRRIQLLEQVACLLYKEWFVHLHFPGHEHVAITNGVPEGWEIGKVREKATLVRGKSYKSSELVESGGKPFVNLKCVARHGGFRLDGLKRFSGPHRDDQVVVPGDIVIAVTDMTRERHLVAHPARIPTAMGEEAVFSMDTVKLIPHATVDSSWFYYFLRFSNFSKEVREHATGTNVLHLKPKQITDYVAVFPPRLFQEQFGETVRSILDQQDNMIIQNERLAKARDLLLPRLMNGEIAV